MRYFGFAERSGDHRRDSTARRRPNEHMFLGMTSYSYGVVHQDSDRKWSYNDIVFTASKKERLRGTDC